MKTKKTIYTVKLFSDLLPYVKYLVFVITVRGILSESIKVKVTPVQALRLCTGRTAHRGSRGIALPFHDHALEGGEGSASRPCPSLPRKRPGTLCTGVWVGPRAGLDRCRKSRLPPGFDPRTVYPVANRYTD